MSPVNFEWAAILRCQFVGSIVSIFEASAVLVVTMRRSAIFAGAPEAAGRPPIPLDGGNSGPVGRKRRPLPFGGIL